MSSLIQVEDLSFTYPGQPAPALQNVSLRIEEGEFVALVGANGSGKSTLARHFNGILTPGAGRVLVEGQDTRRPEARTALRARVGMVFQAPEDQMAATLVEDEVAFGPENLGVPPAEIRSRVALALEAVGMQNFRERSVHQLSAGQMQRVAVASLLAMRPRLFVFDESTAMLDPQGRQTLLDLMDHLHHEGFTIVMITHYMEEAARAGRVVALQNGSVALDGAPAQVFSSAEALNRLHLDLPPAAALANLLRARIPALPGDILSVEELTRALLASKTSIPTAAAVPLVDTDIDDSSGFAVLVDGLGHTYPVEGSPVVALEDVSMQVSEGSAHALIGATGSGKSTLLLHLNGLLRPQIGRVRAAGFDLNDPACDLKALRRNVGLVFQIPERYFFETYVGDEIAYGVRRLVSAERTVVRERVFNAMQHVGLDFTAFKDRPVFTLSSGERRKVALASTLAIEPRLLLLDEPAAGLDPLARRELIALLRAFRESGTTLVLASHQMEDVAAVTGRITALHGGRNWLSGTTAEVFGQTDALQRAGLCAPAAARVAAGLRAAGWNVPGDILDGADLLRSLTGGAR